MSTTTKWLDERKSGIGASEAAAAIGISPWQSRLQLWGEKTGRLESKDLSGIERIQWGTYLQPQIAKVYAERTGRSVRQNRSNVIRRHADYDFMLATLDGQQRANGGPKRAAENEIKAAMGTATFGELPDGGRFSWKTSERHDPPREATTITIRTLRRLKT